MCLDLQKQIQDDPNCLSSLFEKMTAKYVSYFVQTPRNFYNEVDNPRKPRPRDIVVSWKQVLDFLEDPSRSTKESRNLAGAIQDQIRSELARINDFVSNDGGIFLQTSFQNGVGQPINDNTPSDRLCLPAELFQNVTPIKLDFEGSININIVQLKDWFSKHPGLSAPVFQKWLEEVMVERPVRPDCLCPSCEEPVRTGEPCFDCHSCDQRACSLCYANWVYHNDNPNCFICRAPCM